MKKLILSLCLLGFSAYANAVEFDGRCTVLQQNPVKLLANVNVALKAGETKKIYQEGNIVYEVSLDKVDGTPNEYVLQTIITYGDPNFIAGATATYSETELSSGAVAGAGISLPHYPTFGCGRP